MVQSCVQKKSLPVNQQSNLSLANNRNGQKTHLFGIELKQPASLELLREVEEFYGREVREVDNTFGEKKSAISMAESNIPSGIPTIIVHRVEGKDEGVIVHELYHLKLFAMGFSPTPQIWDGKTETIEPFVV